MMKDGKTTSTHTSRRKVRYTLDDTLRNVRGDRCVTTDERLLDYSDEQTLRLTLIRANA